MDSSDLFDKVPKRTWSCFLSASTHSDRPWHAWVHLRKAWIVYSRGGGENNPVQTFTKATACQFTVAVISRIDEGKATRCIIPAATSEAKKKISKCAFVCFASREATSRAGSGAQDKLWCSIQRWSLFSLTRVHLRLPHCCDKSRHQRGDTFHDIIYATFPTVRQLLIRAVNLHLAPSRRTRIHERLQQHAPVAQILIEHSSL